MCEDCIGIAGIPARDHLEISWRNFLFLGFRLSGVRSDIRSGVGFTVGV